MTEDFRVYAGHTMTKLSLLITKFALLEDLICALVGMIPLNTKWVITLLLFGLEKTITIQGKFYISLSLSLES